MRETVPLWKHGAINPATPEFQTVSEGEKLTFVPLEAVWPGGRADFSRTISWSDKLSYTPFRRGDVLIPKITPTFEAGRSVVADIPTAIGLATTEVHVVRPRPEGDARYLCYIARSLPFLDEGAHSLQGVGNLRRITPRFVQEHRILDADPKKQTTIADYLDRETGEIDAMIAKLDELTEQLSARKISFIQRGTQFNASGERWDSVPTAHLFGSIGSGTTPKRAEHYTDADNGVPWITTSELRESEILDTAKRVTQRALEDISSLRVHPRGSIAIAMYGATIGRLGTLGIDAATNQACCVFSAPRGVDMRFFYYTLLGQRDDIVRLAVGGGQPNISQTMLRRWRVPCPPLDEQIRVADELDEASTRVDAMLAKVADLKSLLLERRAALITDVVTGRKEVV